MRHCRHIEGYYLRAVATGGFVRGRDAPAACAADGPALAAGGAEGPACRTQSRSDARAVPCVASPRAHVALWVACCLVAPHATTACCTPYRPVHRRVPSLPHVNCGRCRVVCTAAVRVAMLPRTLRLQRCATATAADRIAAAALARAPRRRQRARSYLRRTSTSCSVNCVRVCVCVRACVCVCVWNVCVWGKVGKGHHS